MIGFVMMALGDYRFALANAAFEELERSTSWRWASQETIGMAPTLQYIGPGEDTMNMRGSIFPHFRGGLGQVDSMRAQAGRGVPLLLVDGTGRYLGEWVVETISETRTTFFSDGAPRKIDFGMQLKKYA